MHEETDIMLVEDNPLDIDLTLHELRGHRLANRIHLARDGEAALAFLFGNASSEAGSRAKLILLDTRLPKVDGLEVLRAIRSHENTKMIPVLVLISSAEQQKSIECYNLGVTAYLWKPVSFDTFRETVRKIGMFWLVVDEPYKRDQHRRFQTAGAGVMEMEQLFA